MARDPEMLDLAANAKSTPVTNLFFAAAHSLLLGRAEHPVARFYPSASGETTEMGDPYPPFRSFCLEHAEEICEIISSRRVQTNEVRRCALLLPAFGLAAERSGKPLTLVEVGASAGLNLLFDRYSYDYGESRCFGDAGSPVQISCEVRGEPYPPIPARMPEISSRTGIDLNPLDVRDPESALWLRALIWPEEYAGRAPILERAIETARLEPPTLLRGDALDLLPQVLREIPEGAAACVFHTFTLNQFSEQARSRFASLLSGYAKERELYRVSIEWLDADDAPLLRFSTFEGGDERQRVLARCGDHGGWIQWES